MLHATQTSETKTQTAQSKTQLVPQPERELHPHLSRPVGLYSPNGTSGISSTAQQHPALARIQSAHGNQAVLRMMRSPQQVMRMTPLRPSQGMMLQRKCACDGSSEAGEECAECKAKREEGHEPVSIQTKLQVNQPGDQYEQEAERVSDQVMRMAIPKASVTSNGNKALVRRVSNSSADLAVSAPPIVNEVLSSHGGQPLDKGTRAFMEPRFGYDFSGVRVHTDAKAAESARSVKALAYTVGRDLVFGTGQYAPGTSGGQRLLAHELTHTIQQGAAGAFSQAVQQRPALAVRGALVQRQSDDSPGASVPEQSAIATLSPEERDRQYQGALQSAIQESDPQKATDYWMKAAELLNGFNRKDILYRLAQRTTEEIGNLHQGAFNNPRVGPQSQLALLTEPNAPLASTVPPIATQAPPDLSSPAPREQAIALADQDCEAITRLYNTRQQNTIGLFLEIYRCLTCTFASALRRGNFEDPLWLARVNHFAIQRLLTAFILPNAQYQQAFITCDILDHCMSPARSWTETEVCAPILEGSGFLVYLQMCTENVGGVHLSVDLRDALRSVGCMSAANKRDYARVVPLFQDCNRATLSKEIPIVGKTVANRIAIPRITDQRNAAWTNAGCP